MQGRATNSEKVLLKFVTETAHIEHQLPLAVNSIPFLCTKNYLVL